MATTDPDALSLPGWTRRLPNPASRYSSDLIGDRPPVFDRKTREAVPWHWLKSYRRALVRHHLHSEMKFLGGEDSQRGVLRRRHVHAWAVIPIGKEADNLEERETLGDGDDSIEWSMSGHDRVKITNDIEDLLTAHRISARALWTLAGVSHHTLADLRAGRRITELSLLSVARAAEELRNDATTTQLAHEDTRLEIQCLVKRAGSVTQVAKELGFTRQYLGRVLRGQKPITLEIVDRVRALRQQSRMYANADVT